MTSYNTVKTLKPNTIFIARLVTQDRATVLHTNKNILMCHD